MLWSCVWESFCTSNCIIIIVATCPSAGVMKKASRLGQGCVFHWRKMRGVSTNVYSRKMSEKPKWKRSKVCVFWKWGFGSCLRTGKVLASYTSVTKDDSLQPNVQNMTSKLCIFPSYIFYVFFLFIFFYFLGSTRVLPSLLRILRCDEEIRPT